MVHINEDGELVKLEGSLLEIGADTSCLIATTALAVCEDAGGDADDIARYIATVLKTAIDAVKNKEVKEGIRNGCLMAVEYEGMDNKFRIYKNNGSLTGYKS